MDNILDKLDKMIINDNDNDTWKDWSLEQIKKILEIYYIISAKEDLILDLIHKFYCCDSSEDIFCIYNKNDICNKELWVSTIFSEVKHKNELRNRIINNFMNDFRNKFGN